MCIRDRIFNAQEMIASSHIAKARDVALNAVSYTHLDVYKRQERYCASEIFSVPETFFKACLLYTSRCV